MGVSLETGQSKFASIIEELSQVPTTLSQFFVWVDLCVAEYKTKGSVLLDCSGGKPYPDWLHGLKEILESNNVLQQQQRFSGPSNFSGNIYKDRQRELETACDGFYYQGQATHGKSNISAHGQTTPATCQKLNPKTIQYIYVQPKMTHDASAKMLENKKQKTLATSTVNTNQITEKTTQKESAAVVQTDINGNTNLLTMSAYVMPTPGKIEVQKAGNLSRQESTNSVAPVSLYISPQKSVNSVDKTAEAFPNSSPKKLNKCLQSPAASLRTKRKNVLISNFLETAKLQNVCLIKTEVVSDEENDSGLRTVDIVGNCSKKDDLPLVITDIRTDTDPCLSTASRIRHNNDTSQDCFMIGINPTVKTEPVPYGWQRSHGRVRGKDYVPGPVKKARTNVGNMKVWLREVYGEERQIEDMPPQELDKYLSEFLMDVRKRNGEDYDPNSFKDIRGSFERHLHDHGYPYSIIKSGLFAKTQKAYIKKRDILRNVLRYKMLNNQNGIL